MQQDASVVQGLPEVWIVEDNPDYRETVRELLESADGLRAGNVFGSGEELFEHLNKPLILAPEVILVDIGLPGMSGIEIAGRIRGFARETRVVMLTIHEDNDRIFEALCAGACGYLLKTAEPEVIISSVREALSGGAPMTPQIARRVLNLFTQIRAPRWDYELTDRERDVLRELVEGKTKREMGKSLYVSEHTIDSHLRSIYQKLHVHSRTEAVVKALTENLVSLDEDQPQGGDQ